MKKKLFVLLTALLCVVLFQSAAMAKENAAEYLSEYYGITFTGDNVSAEEFNNALSALGAEPLSDVESLTVEDAVIGAVRVANMEELALAYAGNAEKILADEEVRVEEKYAPYVAIALDQDLVDDDDNFSGPLTARRAARMLYRAAEISGKGRHYIGRVSDDEILPELQSTLSAMAIFDDDTLSNAGIEILVQGATTGYSMKYSGYDARFLEENTLRYGHSDPTHAMQLVALMKAENLDAYVQIEPKVSVYEYMLDWGEPSDPTPTYAVHEMDDRYFAFAIEYDMALEFDSPAEKEKFHDLIETYAKKYDNIVDEDGNPTKPLLASSWWQPLYYSTTGMKNAEFKELVDNVIAYEGDTYSIHSFSVPEDSDAVAEAAKSVDANLTVTPRTITVNPAFYRYITGEDHQ